MTAPFVFTRNGRRPATAIGLGVAWALLLAAYLGLDAAWWIVAPLALFTLPAVYDLVANPVARLELSDRGLGWATRGQSMDLPLARIAKMRFDTRLDFSVRVTAILADGGKLRLPYDCLPPPKAFESALRVHGVETERHHFQLW